MVFVFLPKYWSDRFNRENVWNSGFIFTHIRSIPTQPPFHRHREIINFVFLENCVVDYMPLLGESGQISSMHRSCEYNINYSTPIQLTFKINSFVPQNSSINVLQGIKSLYRFKSIANITSKDSGKTRYFRNRVFSDYDVITIRTDTGNMWSHLNFTPFISGKFY